MVVIAIFGLVLGGLFAAIGALPGLGPSRGAHLKLTVPAGNGAGQAHGASLQMRPARGAYSALGLLGLVGFGLWAVVPTAIAHRPPTLALVPQPGQVIEVQPGAKIDLLSAGDHLDILAPGIPAEPGTCYVDGFDGVVGLHDMFIYEQKAGVGRRQWLRLTAEAPGRAHITALCPAAEGAPARVALDVEIIVR